MSKVIFDIGGNAVQYRINDLSINEFSTINKDKNFVLNKIAEIVNDNKIKNVGISSPCGVDSESGQLYGISGIKDYGDFNLYEELKALIKHDINILAHNDANAALLGNLVGESYLSAAQITIGTGIGGAIYSSGSILEGKLGMAGEFGYAPFDNNKNTSEKCSSNALVSYINDKNNKKYKNFLEVLESGINYNIEIEEWANNFAKLLSQILFFISPEVIFISGGITKNNQIQSAILNSFEILLSSFKYKFNFNILFKNVENPAILGMSHEVMKKSKKEI